MHTRHPLTLIRPDTTRNIELWVCESDGTPAYCVATVHPLELASDGSAEDNARLFAGAGDLLAALKMMLAAAKCNYDPVVALSEYGAQAEAAIAKTGGTPAQTASPRCDQVIIYMEGGVVQQVESPRDVEVEVRDYDIENYGENELVEDECGNRYRRIEFDGKKAP